MNNVLINEAQHELVSIQDVVRWAVSRCNEAKLYYGHGTDNSLDDVLQLILYTLHLPLDTPDVLYNTKLTSSEKMILLEKVKQRIEKRMPVPYLTNVALFCGHEFYVDERVLIPRSPIGELIDNDFDGILLKEPNAILDLCTGSGCIAIACSYAFPDANVDAVDISEEALLVAERNIQEHNKEKQVIPIRSDLFNEVPPIKYDLIVSNPPYVDAEDMGDLPNEYRTEPELALAAGDDGLDIVKRILANAADFLTPEGILICEVGNSQVHLIEQYPQIDFTWLSFERGGDGVFMLTYQQLIANQARFEQYK